MPVSSQRLPQAGVVQQDVLDPFCNCGGSLAYYGTPSRSEVDFVWSRGRRNVGIEVKASERWRPEYGRALRDLHGAGVLSACYAVYLGATQQRDGPVRVLPVPAFLDELSAGLVLAARPPRTKRSSR